MQEACWWGQERKAQVTEPTPASIPSRLPTLSPSTPLDFTTSIRPLSQKRLTASIPILKFSQAGRPEVEFVPCLTWVTLNIEKSPQ